MKIKLEIELDTDKLSDLELVDDIIDELASFRKILKQKCYEEEDDRQQR